MIGWKRYENRIIWNKSEGLGDVTCSLLFLTKMKIRTWVARWGPCCPTHRRSRRSSRWKGNQRVLWEKLEYTLIQIVIFYILIYLITFSLLVGTRMFKFWVGSDASEDFKFFLFAKFGNTKQSKQFKAKELTSPKFSQSAPCWSSWCLWGAWQTRWTWT